MVDVTGCHVAVLALPLLSCLLLPLLVTRCAVAFLVLVLVMLLIFVLLPSTTPTAHLSEAKCKPNASTRIICPNHS